MLCFHIIRFKSQVFLTIVKYYDENNNIPYTVPIASLLV